jgi:ArsR family transcriptional regulator
MTLLDPREGELCVRTDPCLDDSQPKISRHLAQLRSCGLLLDRRQGQWIYYRINPALPDWVTQVLDITLQANQPWLRSDAQRLDAMGDRPNGPAPAAEPSSVYSCLSPLPFLLTITLVIWQPKGLGVGWSATLGAISPWPLV